MQDKLIFKKIKAVTLLELLISLFIFALVSASVSLIFNRSLFVYRVSTDKNFATQETQTAIEWLVRDIETAYAVVVAQANNIALVDPQQRYIRYYLEGNQIKRKECANQDYLLAENVTQFSLKYYDSNNNPVDPVANLLSLRAIEIDMTITKNAQEFRLNSVARFEYDPKCAWVKAYGGTGGDYINALQQTKDGGYISGGDTASFGAGGDDQFLLKTDATGKLSWAKTYGGAGGDELRFLQQAKDGGYITAGYTKSFGVGLTESILIKTDAVGNLTWAKTYGGAGMENLYSLCQTSDGEYVASGYTDSFGAGGEDGFLIKTDADGNVGAAYSGTWAKTYGGTGNDYLRCLRQTNDGGYIAAGWTDSFGAGGADLFLVKTDAAGNFAWAKAYGGTGTDELHSSSLSQTSDGGYIMAGWTDSFGAGGADLFLIKTDADGNMGAAYPGTWAKAYGGTGDDKLYSLQETSDGGYIMAGWTDSFGAGGDDLFLLKTDAAGNIIWAKAYGGTGSDELYSLYQTNDGGYIAAGYTASFGAGGDDLFLLKTDAAGNLGCCSISQTVSPTLTDATSATSVNNVTSSVGVNTVTSLLSVSSPAVLVNTADIATTPVCPSP